MFSGTESKSYENAATRLLYFSESAILDSLLRDCLIREGFYLRLVETEQDAVNILHSAFAADALVIYHDQIANGSMIACAFKSLCPQIPIILLSAQSPSSDMLPLGVDALYYGNVRGDDSAPGIASAIRQLVGILGNNGRLPRVGHEAYLN